MVKHRYFTQKRRATTTRRLFCWSARSFRKNWSAKVAKVVPLRRPNRKRIPPLPLTLRQSPSVDPNSLSQSAAAGDTWTVMISTEQAAAGRGNKESRPLRVKCPSTSAARTDLNKVVAVFFFFLMRLSSFVIFTPRIYHCCALSDSF